MEKDYYHKDSLFIRILAYENQKTKDVNIKQDNFKFFKLLNKQKVEK